MKRPLDFITVTTHVRITLDETMKRCWGKSVIKSKTGIVIGLKRHISYLAFLSDKRVWF